MINHMTPKEVNLAIEFIERGMPACKVAEVIGVNRGQMKTSIEKYKSFGIKSFSAPRVIGEFKEKFEGKTSRECYEIFI